MIGWLLDLWSRMAQPAAGITYIELESVWRVVAETVYGESEYNEIDMAVCVHYFAEKKERYGPVCLSAREYLALCAIIYFVLIDVEHSPPTEDHLNTARRFLERTRNDSVAQ